MSAVNAVSVVSGRRLSWLRIKAVARRHYYVLLRAPHRLFDVTIWPLVDVLLFGSIAAFVSAGKSASSAELAAGYLLSGILLWHVVYQSQIALATGFLEEAWTRNLLNLMVTPMREVEYVAGVVLFGMIKLAIGLTVVTLTALGFFAFNVTDLGIGLIPVAAVLLVVGWVIALFVIALVLRFGTGAEALAWGILFVVMPLSGVFYPVEALPEVLQPLSLALPSTHAFVAGRALFDGRGILWGELGIALIGCIVLGAMVLLFLTRMLSRFRSLGYISRYT
jgi:ABC-2 type transport system permease protein